MLGTSNQDWWHCKKMSSAFMEFFYDMQYGSSFPSLRLVFHDLNLALSAVYLLGDNNGYFRTASKFHRFL